PDSQVAPPPTAAHEERAVPAEEPELAAEPAASRVEDAPEVASEGGPADEGGLSAADEGGLAAEGGAAPARSGPSATHPAETKETSQSPPRAIWWKRPNVGRSFFAAVAVAVVVFAWVQVIEGNRVEESVKEASEIYLQRVANQDAAALAEMIETPFFFGERRLGTHQEVQNHFSRLFENSKENLGEEERLNMEPAMYRGALFSRWLAEASELPNFEILESAQIDVLTDINSSNERENPTGPPPTFALGDAAARATVSLQGFSAEDLEAVYLYFSVRDDRSYLRGVLLR
ncbi:MAG: hypothetical protein O7J95_05465, partial [Planctomycetota bacterium]|nr:hypothetical protein [Planctomycetota bacterium]